MRPTLRPALRGLLAAAVAGLLLVGGSPSAAGEKRSHGPRARHADVGALKIPTWLVAASRKPSASVEVALLPAPKSEAAPPASQSGRRTRGGRALSSEQRGLMAIYRGDGERADATAIPGDERAPEARVAVSDAAIMAAVTREKRSVQSCYERVLKHDESMRSVRVDVEVKVSVSGAVQNVSFGDRDVSSSELGRCLTQSIRRWRFPSQDGEYQTAFPLLLQAQ